MLLIEREEPSRLILELDPIMASHVYKGIQDGKAHQTTNEEA